MKTTPKSNVLAGTLAFLANALLAAGITHAEMSQEELAKLAQNPIGNLISVPFQDNLNLNTGPLKLNQNVLNIQPVIPNFLPRPTGTSSHARSSRSFLSRRSIRAVCNYGIGPTQISAFLSPATPNGLIWGIGAITQVPTATNDVLGSNQWGLGPTFVILKLEKGNPWVYGVLVNDIWSVGYGSGGSYNNLLAQPFVNYNFSEGLYLTSGPIITANLNASSGNVRTIPVGGGIGKIFHFGKLPVNTQLGGYYTVARPEYVGNWTIRAQVQFMFPK